MKELLEALEPFINDYEAYLREASDDDMYKSFIEYLYDECDYELFEASMERLYATYRAATPASSDQ